MGITIIWYLPVFLFPGFYEGELKDSIKMEDIPGNIQVDN